MVLRSFYCQGSRGEQVHATTLTLLGHLCKQIKGKQRYAVVKSIILNISDLLHVAYFRQLCATRKSIFAYSLKSIWQTISVKVETDGKEYDNHLFANEQGIAVIKLNGWEEGVLAEEEKRPDFVCWLRNPSREKWSLCIPYEIGGEVKSAYPDFLIIRSDPQLDYVIDILEPHSPEFKDNLGKAKGLAHYAENEPSIGRVQLIRTGKDPAGKTRFKRLDLSQGAVREKVLKAQNNDELDHIFDVDGFF